MYERRSKTYYKHQQLNTKHIPRITKTQITKHEIIKRKYTENTHHGQTPKIVKKNFLYQYILKFSALTPLHIHSSIPQSFRDPPGQKTRREIRKPTQISRRNENWAGVVPVPLDVGRSSSARRRKGKMPWTKMRLWDWPFHGGLIISSFSLWG